MHPTESRSGLFFFALIFHSIFVSAQNVDLTDFVEKKNFVLAGTIHPPSISLNGQQLETPSGTYKNLYVNGNLVPITNADSLKTFYYTLESETLTLEWERPNGERVPFLKLELPSLNQVTTNGFELHWNFSPLVTQAKLDTHDISLDKPITKLDNIKKWVKQPHILELSSDKSKSQIYQLDFRNHQREIFQHKIFYYSLGEPSVNYLWGADSSGFGFGLLFEDDRYLDVAYYYSEKDRFFNDGTNDRLIKQKLYELKSHYGYQFFNTNWNDFDIFRLHLGVQASIARYMRQSPTIDSFDGFMTDKVDQAYAIVGPFLRWEPLQYRNFGLSLTIDFPLVATSGISSINTNAYLSINYHFK